MSAFYLYSAVVMALLPRQNCQVQPQEGSNPYFAPYLEPNELPDGASMPLFHEIWTVMGSQLTDANFTAQVDIVSKSIFSQYSFRGLATETTDSLAAPTFLDNNPVEAKLLEGDDYSNSMLASYNSVDIHLNVTIDNKAWYPDLGYVARVNHNRLASKMQSEGFNVMAWLCTMYILELPAIQVLHRMPIQTYNSYLVGLAVTGKHLVPMTLQKQNVVTAVIADVLTPSAVWYIRCIGVRQTSPVPGSNTSRGVVSLVVQQDANALWIGQALTNVINDTLGTPLFDVKTAAAGLPLSASIQSIAKLPGDSITDQIKAHFPQGFPKGFARWKTAVTVLGGLLGLLLAIIIAFLCWRRKRGQTQLVRYKSHSLDSLIEMQLPSSSSSSDPPRPRAAAHSPRMLLHSLLSSAGKALHLPGWHVKSDVYGLGQVFGSGSGSSGQLVRVSTVDSRQIRICQRGDGSPWVLGMGSFGVVYKAQVGDKEVAVKAINKQHVNPSLTPQQALQALQKELRILETLGYNRNIVQLYGSYVKDGDLMLLLEYMPGGDLRHAIQGPYHAAVGWYRQGPQVALDILKGIQYLHSHSILHGDIKSGNVLLSQSFDTAKLCDVGLAHIMGNTSVSSQNLKATVAYAAPELLMCLRCDEKADIFSYGVVLWEIITQEKPNRGRLRDLQVPEECTGGVRDMVYACLDQAPAKRPAAAEIAHLLEATIAERLARGPS